MLNLRIEIAKPLRLNARERMTAGGEIQGWCIPVGIGMTSFMMPPEKIAWSGWIYFAMAILVPLHSRFRRRLIRAAGQGE